MSKKKGRSKGIAFIEFMDEIAAKIYMMAIRDPEHNSILVSKRRFIPIVEYTFMDMRTEKKMKGIREKMKANAQKNDPKFKLISEFKKKINESKKNTKKQDTKKSKEEVTKTKEQRTKEHTTKCYELLTKAIESKEREKALEAKKMINRIKSRGKRQRFLKKLYSVFDKVDLAKNKTKKIKKKDKKKVNEGNKKGNRQVKKQQEKKPESLKLNIEEKKELNDLFDQLGKVSEQLKEEAN